MSTYKPYRDYFYLIVVLMHLTAMIGVDFVPFFPELLCQPGYPLYYLTVYRKWYIATMSDPYYDMNVPGHFFEFFVYIELLVQFPLALYLTYGLFTKKPLSGSGELATILYGTTTSLCTATVCHDMWHLGSATVGRSAKQMLLGAYAPYAIIPAIMVADMSSRLLGRLRVPYKPKYN